MNNSTIILKVEERLNKLSSNDYDNIECWQIVEAFNKAQIEWVRRQLRGANLYRDGDENSRRRIDDIQRLLIDVPLSITDKGLYFESLNELPDNYLEFKRIDVEAKKDCCENSIVMAVYLAEEDNRSQLLRDEHKNPSFEWGETFCTLIGNKVRIFTNNKFSLENAKLTYYRFPIYIEVNGCVDPYTSNMSTQDINCEFKDDIIELLIDEAVAIIAGDIESGNQFSRGSESAERNN
jgi:hypothetical protein